MPKLMKSCSDRRRSRAERELPKTLQLRFNPPLLQFFNLCITVLVADQRARALWVGRLLDYKISSFQFLIQKPCQQSIN